MDLWAKSGPKLAVFLCIPFKIPSKATPSPIKPLTKKLDDGFLHFKIWLQILKIPQEPYKALKEPLGGLIRS